MPNMNIDGAEVLRRLLAGNSRFASGNPINPRRSPEDFRAVADGQNPQAVLVSCSDSRVPPELIFDMGVGDIFAVRVAGNVFSGTGPAIKGSIEFAVAELKVTMIMVLGHSNCGAVNSAIQHIDRKDSLPGAINDLVELVKPAVLLSKELDGDPLANAIIQNVRTGVERLSQSEPIIAPRVREGRLLIAGGVFDLHTGRIDMINMSINRQSGD